MCYAIKKFYHYFIKSIDKELEKKAVKCLSYEEYQIYMKMDKYDKVHSLMVYKKLEGECNILKRLALLHDCGKENASFILRVLHKLKFKTKLINHPQAGYDKLKNIDIELANLIKMHHTIVDDELMKKFQNADDRS